MSKVVLSLLVLFGVLGRAYARFGDTPEQCVARYGVAITNIQGNADLEGVTVFSKDDLTITVAFFRGSDRKVSVGMIFYTRARPFSYGFSCVPDMSSVDENAILATVRGQWSVEQPAKGLEGPKRFGGNVNSIGRLAPDSVIPKSTPISSRSGIVTETQNKVAKVLPDVLRVIYPHEISYTPVPLSHNGPHLFSFRVLHGVAICSDDVLSSLSRWIDHVRNQNEVPVSKPSTVF